MQRPKFCSRLAIAAVVVLLCCGLLLLLPRQHGKGMPPLARHPVARMAAKGERLRSPGQRIPQKIQIPPSPPSGSQDPSAGLEPDEAGEEEDASAKTPVQEAPGVPLPYDGVITEIPIPTGCYSPSKIEDQVMELINEERERLGIAPLKPNPDLTLAAHVRAAELYVCDYFAHLRPNGDPWNTVLDSQVPVEYSNAAENLAWSNQPVGGEVEAQRWFDLWKNSPSHYAAMTDPLYSHFGLAILSCPRSSIEGQSFAVTLFCSY